MCTCPDGRPLPVKGVDQTGQFLYSVDLEWDEPPTPADSPITSYMISVIPRDSGRQVYPALTCCVCGQTLFSFLLPSLLISLLRTFENCLHPISGWKASFIRSLVKLTIYYKDCSKYTIKSSMFSLALGGNIPGFSPCIIHSSINYYPPPPHIHIILQWW